MVSLRKGPLAIAAMAMAAALSPSPLASNTPVPVSRKGKTGPLEYLDLHGEPKSMIPSDKGGSSPIEAIVDRAFDEMKLDYEGPARACAGCRVCVQCNSHPQLQDS